jgi:hypothetical protein
MLFIKNSTAVLAQFIIANGCSATVVSSRGSPDDVILATVREKVD